MVLYDTGSGRRWFSVVLPSPMRKKDGVRETDLERPSALHTDRTRGEGRVTKGEKDCVSPGNYLLMT